MKSIELLPQSATPALLDSLQELGLIIRIAPRKHEIAVQPGQALGKPVYNGTDPKHGGHLLLACTINQTGFARFGWHLVPEEFLLIGPTDAEPLYLAIFRGTNVDLQAKIETGTLGAEDFTCIRCNFNDPETSFFTMRARVPHGECVAAEGDRPPSFYVTEPVNTTILAPDWQGYSLALSV